MEEERIQLRDLFEILNRRRHVIYSVLAVFVISAVVYNLIASPVYQALVSIRVNPRGANEYTGTVGYMSNSEDEQAKILTIAEIAKSHSVLEGVIDREYGDIPKEQRPSVESLAYRISIVPVKNTTLLNIGVAGGSPEEAYTVANTLVEVFQQRMTELARSSGKETRTFIGERLAEAKQNLDKTETELIIYKKDKKTMTVSDQTKNFMDKQGTVTRMKVDNQVAVNSANAKMADVKNQIAEQNPNFVADSPLIQTYKNKLADQEAELVVAKSNLSDLHPKVIALKAGIAETQDKLNAEVARVIHAEAPSSNPVYQGLLQSKIQAETDIAVALAQQQAIRGVENQNDSEMRTIPEKEQGLARLMRDYTVAEEAYTTLAKRYDQARIDEVMQPSSIQVIDLPNAPDRPLRPRKGLNLVLSVVLGLMVGVTAAFGVDYLYKTIDTADDVRRCLGLNVIGSVPSYQLYIATKKRSWWQRLFKSKEVHCG